jgi:hypothetical protein
MHRARQLRQLVLDSQYVIDERRVASAILARAATRALVATASFRNDARAGGPVRSSRPTSRVRSFRPCPLGGLLRARRTAGFAEPL